MQSCNHHKRWFVNCQKEKLHDGDHSNGKKTWPREGEDLEAYLNAASAQLASLREADYLRRAEEKRKWAEEGRKAALRLTQEAELRMSAATCREGDTHTTPGVTHARCDLIASGEDRRADRIRWWTSYKCEKCKASWTELTEWDDL
jgi:hypothetical protein